MKLAAAHALASLARSEVPKDINELYGKEFKFGKNYLIPKPFDKRLIVEISSAVAQAAVDSGASDMKNFNIKDYTKELAKILK